jgi:hypothetical protein
VDLGRAGLSWAELKQLSYKVKLTSLHLPSRDPEGEGGRGKDVVVLVVGVYVWKRADIQCLLAVSLSERSLCLIAGRHVLTN